jgi:hypothetical protein
MGRSSVPLVQYIKEEGLEDEFTVPLGKGDWTNLEGPVSAFLCSEVYEQIWYVHLCICGEGG